IPCAMSWCAVVPGGSARRTGGVCIGVAPWARCSSRASVWLLAFAVAAIGELVAKPAGAAGVALVPAHRDLVLGTPARILFMLRGGERGVFLRRGGRTRPIATRRRLRLHGRLYRRGDLLIEGALRWRRWGRFRLVLRLLARLVVGF